MVVETSLSSLPFNSSFKISTAGTSWFIGSFALFGIKPPSFSLWFIKYSNSDEFFLKSKKGDLDVLSGESQDEEKKLDTLKKKASKKIESSLLLSYEKLVERQRNGLAVVKVKRGACGGCFNVVPPQRQAEIKEKKKIILCEYCGRILADVIVEVVEDKPKKRTKRKRYHF